MNEAMEKAEFMKKPFIFAKSSRQHIERLWKTGIDVLELSASIVFLFSSIFDTMAKAVMRIVGLSQGARELSITRFLFLSSLDLWSIGETPLEEEYFLTEIGRANVSFLFNVTVARKTALDLTRRAAARTPKPALLLEPASLPKEELGGETVKEHLEEPPRTVPRIVADLQGRFESKLAPHMMDATLAFQEYARKTILLAPLPVMPEPPLLGPTRLESPPSRPLMAPAEKEAPEAGLPEKPLDVVSQIPPSPLRESKVEPSPLVSIPFMRLSSEAATSFGYATELPSIVLEQEIPILTGTAGSSLFTTIWPPPPSAEPSYTDPTPTMLPPMLPSQLGRLLAEVSPSLTSWIYGVSEVLRDTSPSLSSVPVAVSTAERVVTEALIQPVSGFEEPSTVGTQEPVSGLEAVKLGEAATGRIEVESFRLATLVSSLILAQSQRYPLLFSDPTIGETCEKFFELTQVAPEETPSLGGMPEVKRLSKLPSAIALAETESLIAQRLHDEFSALTKEIQVARSSYGEKLGELGVSRPIGTTPASPLTFMPYAQKTPPFAPSPARPSPISPNIQNTFNITISAESAEEDLGDLERKISKILSEQIRRYYGSPRI